jgi:hypothetical protein
MTNNSREYQTIKFFRGRKRNNAEMQRLAEARLDFEYRSLLIEENELDLHVAFSKMMVWKWLSWGFLTLAIICLQHPLIALIFFGLVVISCFFSFINKRFFQFVFRSYNLALVFVDGVIFDRYGISFR